MFMLDKKNPMRLVFFLRGARVQLGAEGFMVGFLYTCVGLLLCVMTHFLVKVKNQNLQRGVMVSGIFFCFWAMMKVVYLDHWKTGYRVHAYWPSSWQ